jgi:transcriptional regulator with XRE-family HTH domain
MLDRTKRQRRSTPADRQIAMRVRARRHQLGLSQEKLADGLGVTFQQVQKYENGTNRIGAGRLQRIAQLLGVEPGYFFRGDQHAGNAAAAAPDAALVCAGTRDGAALIAAFNAITDRVFRDTVVRIAQALAAKEAQ